MTTDPFARCPRPTLLGTQYMSVGRVHGWFIVLTATATPLVVFALGVIAIEMRRMEGDSVPRKLPL